MEKTKLPDFWIDSNSLHKKKILRRQKRRPVSKEGFTNEFTNELKSKVVDASGNSQEQEKEEDKDTELDKEMKNVATSPTT